MAIMRPKNWNFFFKEHTSSWGFTTKYKVFWSTHFYISWISIVNPLEHLGANKQMSWIFWKHIQKFFDLEKDIKWGISRERGSTFLGRTNIRFNTLLPFFTIFNAFFKQVIVKIFRRGREKLWAWGDKVLSAGLIFMWRMENLEATRCEWARLSTPPEWDSPGPISTLLDKRLVEFSAWPCMNRVPTLLAIVLQDKGQHKYTYLKTYFKASAKTKSLDFQNGFQ